MTATNRISHSQIDFGQVKEILREARGGSNFAPFLSAKYSDIERQVAILALQEQQLITISNKIRMEYRLQEEVNKKKMTQKLAKDMLNESYQELDMNSKYELMPLFFSTDMVTEQSSYFPEESIRNLVFKSFLSLIKKDKIDLDTLKREYLEHQELAYLLPLQEHVEAGEPAQRQQNKNTEPNIVPKVIFVGIALVAAYYLLF